MLLTLAAAGLAWLASQPRFVLQVPDGTVDLLDDITVVVRDGLRRRARRSGSLAMVVWCVRRRRHARCVGAAPAAATPDCAVSHPAGPPQARR